MIQKHLKMAYFKLYILCFSKNILKKSYKKRNIKEGDIKTLYNSIFSKQSKSTNIEFINLGKVYENGFKAIHDFNLEIKEREFVSLLGPSGCGKTTILRMLAGLEYISEGKLKINNVEMNAALPKDRGLSMVFQNYALYPYMTVYDNIAFGLKIASYNNNISRSLFEKVMESIYPKYVDITYLKINIWNIKHKNFQEIQELKNKHKKNKKFGYKSISEKKDIVNKIKKLKLEERKYFQNNIEEINKIKLKINKLKKENRAIIRRDRERGLVNYRESKINFLESVVVWKNSIRYRINQFAELVGIEKYLNRKPNALSGGQRQRVALVRAISKDTRIYLFDEPLSNLDAKLRSSMRVEIRRIHEKMKATSIFVTHDQIEAITMSDKIVLMNKGFIQQVGSPSDLFDYPANVFVADFIGTPSINFLQGKLENLKTLKIGQHKINFSRKDSEIEKLLEKYIGKNVIVGIRPQTIISDKSILNSFKANRLTAKIKNIENIGHESILYTEISGLKEDFIIVGSKYVADKVGDKIDVAINPNSIILFDANNGFAISHSNNEYTKKAREIWVESKEERIKNQILSDHEKNKEKISRKLTKDLYGLINKKYGEKRKEEKKALSNKEYKD